jgi:hypothetical protein
MRETSWGTGASGVGMRQRGCFSRAVRRLLLGVGPMKRGTDRVEMASRLFLLLLVLATAPVALASAHASQRHLVTVASQQLAERHAARAVIVRPVRVEASSGDPDYNGSPLTQAVVRWSTPTGGSRTASQLTPSWLSAGDTVTVWLTRDGRLTTQPLDPAAANGMGLGVGLMVAFMLPLTAWALHRLLRWLLDRRRMRQWATGWQVVGPVWTARRR